MSDLKPVQGLRPFTKFCCTIGNLPASYLAGLTYEEQLLWFCDYLKNTVIPAINNNAEAVEELQNLYKELKSYVDNYFTNLDVQEEINNKLDTMASDGTLEKIINQEIFCKLNDKINKLEEKAIVFPNFYIGIFYTGGLDGTDIKHPVFKCSLDGKHFTTFNINNNITDNYFTDPCLAFDETTKTFMISYTSYDDDRDCIILTSKDFVNWTEHKINLGYMQPHSNLHRWAPKLFVDDNDEKTIYLTLSLEYKKDENNNPIFKQVLFKCTNKENLTFINIGDILLENSIAEGYIDGYIAKNNGIYYFVVKKDNYDTDNTGVIQLYTTTDIEQTNYYGLVNNYVNFEGLRVEAPTLLFQNNKVNFYAEIYSFSHGGYIMNKII